MTLVLALLLLNAVLGAWDTLWYHEYKAQLPRNLAHTRTELTLHAGRDSIYAVIYGTLAFLRPTGWFVIVLAMLLAAEIIITLADFIVEDRDRPALGGMRAGERVLHTLMAIVYGATLSQLVPILGSDLDGPTALVDHGAPMWMSIAAMVTAIGILGSGLRDAHAVLVGSV